MSFLDGDGFDDYNGVGAAPGLLANYATSGSFTLTLSTGRFGVGQRLSMSANGSNNRSITRQLPAAASTLTVGAMVNPTSLTTGSGVFANVALLQAGTYQVGWRLNLNGGIDVYRYSSASAGTLLGSSANGLFIENVEHYVETTFVINDTTGSVLIKMDGTTIVNLTGQDTKNHATLATADQLLLGFSTTTTGTSSLQFDDMYWKDDATMLGDSRWESLAPASDGATLNLTPSTGTSHFAMVDEALVVTTDYLAGSTAGQLDELGISALSSTPGTIHAVKPVDWAVKTDAGARSIAVGIQSGATVSDGSAFPLLSTVSQFYNVHLTDPNTGAAWTATAVNALKRRLKVAV